MLALAPAAAAGAAQGDALILSSGDSYMAAVARPPPRVGAPAGVDVGAGGTAPVAWGLVAAEDSGWRWGV